MLTVSVLLFGSTDTTDVVLVMHCPVGLACTNDDDDDASERERMRDRRDEERERHGEMCRERTGKR